MSDDTYIKPTKPLGRKAYGSIGHIHGSRLGPGDHSVHEGQSAICVTAAPGRSVFVQTKFDGSCVSAAKLNDGSIIALGRAGYLASDSPHEMHHMWAEWVRDHAYAFDAVLRPGQRIVGEWLAQAHGTIYDLTHREPFVAFDVMTDSTRLTYAEFRNVVGNWFSTPDTMHGPISPTDAMAALDAYGADEPEGVVYRVERKKNDGMVVDFLAKWVRPDKVDGKYLDGDAVWNWRKP